MAYDITQLALSLVKPENELPDPEQLLFYRQLEKREIWLDTDIDYESCAFIIQYIKYLNLAEAEDKTPIKIHIFSGGGSIEVMFMLYTAIRESEIPVWTINEGAAHSAAFIIFLAGDKRTMKPYAHFVAHEGSAGMSGTARETKAAMADYEIDIANMRAIFAERTNLTEDEIQEKYDMTSDWYIRKTDALKYGIITEE